MKRIKAHRDVIGWRELVALPDLGIAQLHAKIDTGARTSALHAIDLEPFEREDVPWVRFRTPIQEMTANTRFEAPVLDARDVKNTSGLPERRLFIYTTLLLGRHRWHIEVSLANRENMGFDLILGRTSIRGRRMLVAPDRSYLAGAPIQKTGDEARIEPTTPRRSARGRAKRVTFQPPSEEDLS